MSKDKFEFIIKNDKDGSPTDLGALTIDESKALLVLLEAITDIVANTINSGDTKIKVASGSAVVAAESSNLGIFYDDLQDIINNESSNEVLVDSYRKIQDLFYSNGIKYEAYIHTSSGSLDIYNKFKSSKRFRTKRRKRVPTTSLVFIKGKLVEVGGIRPNFHILKDNGDKIKICCTESDATRVNSFLYKDILISSWKNSNPGYPIEYRFCDYYKEVDKFDFFQAFISTNERKEHLDYLREINDLAKSYLKTKDFLSLRSFLKLFSDDSIDTSILKTLLIITKSFAEETNIVDIRAKIKRILEKKRGAKLI